MKPLRGFMKKTAPSVYFLVLNYCSYQDTIACVKTIKDIEYENIKLLVIDNCSPDKSGELLNSEINSNEFIQLDKNYGYAGGNNYAIEIALKKGADYVFIVNPDVRFRYFSLKEYVELMQANPDIGAVNPVQLSSPSGSVDERFQTKVLKQISEEDINGWVNTENFIEVETLFGAALMISRKALETVGGFDPLYFAYSEEEDWCRRLRFFNYKIIVFFKSPVIHLRNYNENKEREFLRLKGRYLFVMKDINKGLIPCIKDIYYVLRADYISKVKNKRNIFYDENYYKMLLWFMLNFLKINRSRKIERGGYSHLSKDTFISNNSK